MCIFSVEYERFIRNAVLGHETLITQRADPKIYLGLLLFDLTHLSHYIKRPFLNFNWFIHVNPLKYLPFSLRTNKQKEKYPY
ncbi:hypothetical protein AC625_21260 [Peribacillus loiseleuriae]|uniref:Uncharacterized protein n=1 Tax=Peribacillus loiseleuriae TaxID=1679170 RepID=A0A0K9GYK0_9BACI|nr:hypothetical protein AC625_21260 [Peribacillus loiseleuriae]